jgi:hypothetical protein
MEVGTEQNYFDAFSTSAVFGPDGAKSKVRGCTSGFWERFPKPRKAGKPLWLQKPYKKFDGSTG